MCNLYPIIWSSLLYSLLLGLLVDWIINIGDYLGLFAFKIP